MDITIHVYALRGDDGELVIRVTSDDHTSVSLVVVAHDHLAHVFCGSVRHLHKWSSTRNIPYQHSVLKLPLVLEI